MKASGKLYIFSVLFSGWLTACSGDDQPAPVPASVPEYFESVVNSRQYTTQELSAKTLGDDYKSLFSNFNTDVCIDVIRYFTTNARGEKTLVSGIVSYPVSMSVRSVILAEHHSLGANYDAPSERMYAMESVLSLFNYVVITPDLQGFGVSKDLPHPYLHVENTAATSLDMLFAVREYMEMKDSPLRDDIYIIGYSQGGASALAVQKTAEEKYAGIVRVNKVFAGGGPYDLVALFDEFKKTGTVSFPAYIPMTIIGLDYGDNLHLDYKQVFVEPLLSNYNEWINSKKYSLTEISARIGSQELRSFLHPDFFSADGSANAEFEKIYDSLVRNSLINWTPRAPILLIHGTKDDTVPFVCAQHAYDSFKTRGCDVTLVPVNADHGGAVFDFILYVSLDLL